MMDPPPDLNPTSILTRSFAEVLRNLKSISSPKNLGQNRLLETGNGSDAIQEHNIAEIELKQLNSYKG